jgi:hypothetical protein
MAQLRAGARVPFGIMAGWRLPAKHRPYPGAWHEIPIQLHVPFEATKAGPEDCYSVLEPRRFAAGSRDGQGAL